MANATLTNKTDSISLAEVRSISGIKRFTAKVDLCAVCTAILKGIQSRNYEGAYPVDLYNAAYGILHGIQTGRVDGSYAAAVTKISGAKAAEFVISIASKKLSGDDVARYLNGRPFVWNGERWVADYR